MFTLAMAAMLAASSPQTQHECTPIPAWEEVIAEKDPQYIVIGELHGTEEMPAIFADAVCLTAQEGPVAVALEVPDRDQPIIDAFLVSDGGEAARSELLQSLWFQNSFKDGRSSEAMFTLIERLRQMYQAGSITGVTAFRYVPENEALSSGEYEQRVAGLIMAAASQSERVLVLVGNVHAQTSEVIFGDRTYLPMAGNLPREDTLSLLLVDNGGDSWNCTGNPTICGVSSYNGPDEPHTRGVSISDNPDLPYDAMLYLGVPTTASLPAE